jgi:hypothetical protein
MTISFKEFAGSPVETIGPEGMKATRTLLCAWDDREAVLAQLLGDGYEFGGKSRAAYPGKPDVVAMRTRCEPLADDLVVQEFPSLSEGLNRYHGFAKLTVRYELLVGSGRSDAPEVAPGTFLTYRQDRDYEIVPMADDALAWQDQPAAGIPEEAIPQVRVPIIVHHLTWHRVVSPPWAAIRAGVGTVNDAAFLGAAAGAVLFDGCATEPEFLRIGDLAQAELASRIEYVFREKAVKTGDGAIVGWNHAYRSLPADDPGWDQLVDAAGNRPYRSSDFAALFEFATT